MLYGDAKQYLQSLENLGSIPGTETIRELLFRVHNPEKQLRVIHIAGTNGKGSVGAFLESVLIAAGYHVGRYASPAVFDDLEIISLQMKPISEEDFAKYVSIVKVSNDSMLADGRMSATRFEVETTVAFLYFADMSTDYVLVECGMGGLLDATNVFEKPLLSVITNISYDHMAFLGNSLSEIATQKAGIMKSKVACIASHSCEESDQALEEYAISIGAKLEFSNAMQAESAAQDGLHCVDADGNKWVLGLRGAYQLQNAALALKALQKIVPDLPMETIQEGFKNVVWKGRFQIIHRNPTVILDGAHNPDGMLGLRNSLLLQYPNQQIICVIGVFADKDYVQELSILNPFVKEYVCIETPNHPRALPAKKLAETIRMHYDVPVYASADLHKALQYAKERAVKETVIVCCGSLSHLKFINEIMKSWE